MSSADQIAQRLQELSSFIESAQQQLQKGEVVNLSHVDAEVAQLCDQTLKLKAEEAVQIQPVMAEMISKLEELGVALKDFQTHMKAKS